MNKFLLSAALAGVVAASVAGPVSAATMGKEKCFGVAKAGKNNCRGCPR